GGDITLDLQTGGEDELVLAPGQSHVAAVRFVAMTECDPMVAGMEIPFAALVMYRHRDDFLPKAELSGHFQALSGSPAGVAGVRVHHVETGHELADGERLRLASAATVCLGNTEKNQPRLEGAALSNTSFIAWPVPAPAPWLKCFEF